MNAAALMQEVSAEPDARRVNYFDSPEAAARYAAARPRGHERILTLLRLYLERELPVARALDVGCGAGASTVALLPFARHVTGVEPSSFMLAQAPARAGVVYRKGHAEALPFAAGEFDLLTVASAYHWFDHERFLREAARVLRPGGWLVLYKVGSTGSLVAGPEYDLWWRESFRVRYPRVARNGEPLTAARAAQFGFIERAYEAQVRCQTVTLREQVENLLSHSSVIRGTDQRGESVAVTRAWLTRELERFFPEGRAVIEFEDWLHLVQRRSES